MSEKVRRAATEDWIKYVESQQSRRLTEDEKDLIEDGVKWAGIKSSRVIQWSENTLDIVRRILSQQAAPSDFALFWIRFYGVAQEIREHLLSGAKMLLDEDKFAEFSKRSDNFMGVQIQMVHALDAVLAKLSDEEKIFIEYLRMNQSHPLPFGMVQRRSSGRKGTGELNVHSTYEVKLIGKRMDVSAIDEAIGSIFKQENTVSEDLIALRFCERIQEPLFYFEKLLQRWKLLLK